MMETGDLMGGRFRLHGRLGAGGMSVVWRAHDEVLGRDVAVKVLSPELAHDPVLLEQIRAEARAVARLRHPNIVDVYDYGEVAGPQGRRLPYVVMEVVDGRSLEQLLTAGALPWRVAVLVSAQVAAALAAAHGRGVVHRDVKPANVVVAGARVKLVDFGISAASGDDDRSAGQLLGTPAYLAPERLENGIVRPATDVYALGLLLYRAAAGHLPWQASTTTQMLHAHRYQEPAGLPPIADLPTQVADLCRRCLDKDPDRRPPAAQVAELLAAAAGLTPAALLLPDAAASAPAAPPTRTARLPAETVRRRLRDMPRRRRLALVACGGVLLLTGTAAALAGKPPSRVDSPASAAGLGQRPTECTVEYAVAEAARGHFTTKVSVANTGTVPIPAAHLTFTLPGEQRLTAGTSGTWRQSGQVVSARIGDLPAGRTHTATIRGTFHAANALPDRFEVNDATCRTVLSIAEATTPPPVKPDEKPAQKGKKNDTPKGKATKNGKKP